MKNLVGQHLRGNFEISYFKDEEKDVRMTGVMKKKTMRSIGLQEIR